MEILQNKENDIYALNDQFLALTDVNHNIKNNNALLQSTIRGQRQFLLDLQKKLQQRKDSLTKQYEIYRKANIQNKDAKQKNQKLKNSFDAYKKLVAEAVDEIEKVDATSEDDFNDDDVFEALHLSRITVDSLNASLEEKRRLFGDADVIVNQYKQQLNELNQQENNFNSQILELNDRLYELQQNRSNAFISCAIPIPDLQVDNEYVDALEKEIENINDMIKQIDDSNIERDLKKARKECDVYISKIEPRKKALERKKRKLYKERIKINNKIARSPKKVAKTPERTFPYENEFFDATKVIVGIFDRLYHRKRDADETNLNISKDERNIFKERNEIEKSWKSKMDQIQKLNEKYNALMKLQVDVSMEQGVLDELKEEKEVLKNTIKTTEHKIHIIKEQIEMNQIDLDECHDKEEKNNVIESGYDKMEKTIQDRLESFNQEKMKIDKYEKKLLRKEEEIEKIEDEAKTLNEKLLELMKHFENVIV
ncbi:hypothetical protein TRFO_06679 [Tritrichomonas foetus]|uniref:Uncharacterized protein n=1 Tax=Tritrichomonas foetus TaxID=1144522 RepID=A0A1J4JWC5_9EUKA|nr:hypothetical protein TRFO_06679 [Tritrichomonas foetus]|eukprot:OHT03439.1 hypothetical protein TRFO_06679 [Tritrichomonas foetus]